MRFLALCLAAGALTAAGPSHAKTLLILQSEEGDYIGQGELRTFQAGDGTFTASGDQGVSVSFSGAEFWFLDFSAPADAELQPILYPDAERFDSATVPGLDVGGDGRGCNEVEGPSACTRSCTAPAAPSTSSRPTSCSTAKAIPASWSARSA